MLALVATLALLLVPGAPPGGGARARGIPAVRLANLTASSSPVVNSSLSVGAPLGTLTPEFWGYNYDYTNPQGYFANYTIAAYVNSTPIDWLRLPLLDTLYNSSAHWRAVASFCSWIHCHMIATVGGPGVNASAAVQAMQRAASYGIQPDYWAFGNEPNLWNVSGQPVPSITYAELIHQWIALARPHFPKARFLGAEVTGNTRFGADYIYNTTLLNGPNLSGMAIQLYPQAGGTTVAAFLRSLTVSTSVARGVTMARALMEQACPSCSIPILLNEFQGGSGYNTDYAPFRAGFPDATFFAASMVQALDTRVVQFAPWTLTGSPTGLMTHPGNCEMGLIELATNCTGATLSPTYYLYANLLDRLPLGSVSAVTDTTSPAVYAVRVTNSTSDALLLVNTDTLNTQQIGLGAGFPGEGAATTFEMDPSVVATPNVRSFQFSPAEPAQVVLPPLGIMVVELYSAPHVELQLAPTVLAFGQSLTVEGSAADFPGSVTYSYLGLPPGCTGSNVSSVSCTPEATGHFAIQLTVSDAAGLSAGAWANLTVLPSNHSGAVVESPEVRFEASGLPSGAYWSVWFRGAWHASAGSVVSVGSPNGTYNYTISAPAGYLSTDASGFLDIDGRNVTVPIAFATLSGNSPLIPLSFTQSGLPRSAAWEVVLPTGNLTFNATGGTVLMDPGVYPFRASAAGYRADPGNGTVQLARPATVNVRFSAMSPTPAAIDLGELARWVAPGALLAAFAIAASIGWRSGRSLAREERGPRPRRR